MIRKMILAGFAMLCLATAAISAAPDNTFTAEDRAWWAIQPLRDPEIPRAAPDAHPVDAFVNRRRSEAHLTGAAPASPEEFLRRACFDLHGLPPTPEHVDTFRTAWERDHDAAVETLINDLLASPRYGERWAQHWLDVVRYAESDGYREDAFRPDAFRYRDYVIRAFSEDKPYNLFVREQLAADEFAADDPEALIATGFLRLGIYEWNQRNAEMQHELMINEITRLTGEAFLGIGIGCAQCHDHRFDPLLQRDYYALQSFLVSTCWPTDRLLGTPEQLGAHARWEGETASVRAGMRKLLAGPREKATEAKVKSFPENVQKMYWKPEAERSTYEQQIVMLVQRQVDRDVEKIDAAKALAKEKDKLALYKELQAELVELEKREPKLPRAFVSLDISARPARAVMGSGADRKEIEPAFLALLDEPAPEIVPKKNSTGRRSALAEWMVGPGNPFTARVYVNRIWQHHFGTGLVATPNDFGTLGEPPSHPELLDWLTSRFLEEGWTTKTLHRLIMTSAAYRQTARREPGEVERLRDPNNRLLWRFPPARLSAEQVRDAMLSVSGELKHRPAGGPSTDGNAPVRSIFVKKLRNTPDDVLKCFDAPAGFDSAPERQDTTTTTQALLLSNNDWPMARARAFAKRVLGSRKEVTAEDIAAACRLAWGREASADEVQIALGFIREQARERAKQKPPAPVVKFPNENGLRPITQNFANLDLVEPASRSLWLQPGSRFERLHVREVALENDSFTIEAVVQLDATHKDGTVNTLVSRWNGNHSSPGWTFGVTSAKSRYQPRNFIVQLIGSNPGGDVEYEVVASNLRVPLGKPVYLAAVVEPRPEGRGTVRFFLKDLSDPAAQLRSAEISHNIAGDIQDPGTRLLIGGRDGKMPHLWDGQVGRLAIQTDASPEEDDLLIRNTGSDRDFRLHLSIEGENGAEPLPNSGWLVKPAPPRAASNPQLEALTDFCHALLSSNEFLYLH